MHSVRINGRVFETRGDEAIAWIEEHCVFTNAEWTGEPFRLLPWQRKLLDELFEIDPRTGYRRYRRALIGVGRKNGKSELAAALALYFAFGEGEPSSQVYCAAASEDQADMVFGALRRMAEMSPTLGAALDIPAGTRVSQPRIVSKADPYCFVQRLTSKGATKHGLNPYVVVLDELHVWGVGEAEELWSALNTGSAARRQPMQIAITTAGTDVENSRCGSLYLHGRAIERGEIEDDSFLFRWWSAPDECDYRDPAAWRLANPSLGAIATESFYQGELGIVSEGPFRRLYLNQWVDYAEVPWVTKEQIAACRVKPFDLREREPSWVGVDLSETRDTTAVDVGQWWTDDRPCGHTGEPCMYLRVRTWERPRGMDGKPVPGWEVPQAEVKMHVRELNHDLNVVTTVFDPWHSKLMRQDLANEGITCEEIWQTGARRSGASAQLFDLIVQGRLHFCDDVFERHVMNTSTVATGKDGGYYLSKRGRGKVMDAAMAAVNVVYGATWAPATAGGGIVAYLPGVGAI